MVAGGWKKKGEFNFNKDKKLEEESTKKSDEKSEVSLPGESQDPSF